MQELRFHRGAKISTVDASKLCASTGSLSNDDGYGTVAFSAASAETRISFVGGQQREQQLRGQRAGEEGLVYGVQMRLAATPTSWLRTKPSATWQGKEYALKRGRNQEQEEDNTSLGSVDAIDIGMGTEERVARTAVEATTREVIRLTCDGVGDRCTESNDTGRSNSDNDKVATVTSVTHGDEEKGGGIGLRRAVVDGGGTIGDASKSGTENLLEDQGRCGDVFGVDGDAIRKHGNSGSGGSSGSEMSTASTGNAQRARTIKIWDPVQQLQLFSALTSTATETCWRNDKRTDVETRAGTASDEAGFPPGSATAGVSVGGSGSRAHSRTPVQPGRAAWCEDGETLFLLNHEGEVGVVS